MKIPEKTSVECVRQRAKTESRRKFKGDFPRESRQPTSLDRAECQFREEWDSFSHFSRVTEGCDFCHQDFGKGLEEEIFFFVYVWVTYLSQWREGEFFYL